MTDARLQAALRADRGWVLAAIVAATAVAWIYLLVMAGRMSAMDLGAMAGTPVTRPWTGLDGLLTFVMWAVMMVGMMLPSAAPMILLYGLVNRRKTERGRPTVSALIFAGGYVAAWTVFSLAATGLQWWLHDRGALSPMLSTSSSALGAALLVAAGVYQWSPFKHRCLTHCQSPLHFLTTHWRDGAAGALRMGWEHGLYCLGCCWVLMGLLFVGGVMNLVWIAGLTVFVLAEKLWPRPWIAPATGLALVLWGAAVAAGAA